MNNLRLIELFAGYGSQAMALKRAGIPFEHYKVIEFDKYAIKSYNAVHGTDFPPLDITNITAQDLEIVDTDKYTYLMTYSFPCTDLSIAGKMQGMSKGSGTRSGLLWQVERILNECSELPQFLLMENVTQVHGKKNKKDFDNWISYLESKGYTSKWQDLNANDYGVAQSRNRCFMISYLDKRYNFEFPDPIPLKTCVKDYLEESVEDKYFLKSKKAQDLIDKLSKKNIGSYAAIDLSTNNPQIKTIANCICARTDRGISGMRSLGTGVIVKNNSKLIMVGQMESGKDRTFESINRVYSPQGSCPTINTCSGGDRQPKIFDSESFKIRKLTPLECFRLMGVTDEDAYKMLAANSNSQCYKQAGNSIVVDVMTEIFKRLFINQSDQLKGQMSIFDFI
jgi:DNA (cytosine-5)-methyltransferase 1